MRLRQLAQGSDACCQLEGERFELLWPRTRQRPPVSRFAVQGGDNVPGQTADTWLEWCALPRLYSTFILATFELCTYCRVCMAFALVLAAIEPCIFERLLRGENSDTPQRLVQASRRNQTGNPGDRCRIFRFAPMHRGVFAAATSVHSSRRQRTGTRGGARALPFFGSVRSEDSEIVKIDEISFCEI